MFSIIKNLNAIIRDRVEQSGMPYLIFGIFGIINYPASYFYWHYVHSNAYDNLTFRLIATVLCVLLVLKPFWPECLKPYFPMYWYFTVLFSIPFFATFMALQNHFSSQWLMNLLLGIYWFVLLVDWVSFVIMLVIGMALGCLLYLLVGGEISQITLHSWYSAIYMYLFALLIGGLFSRKNYLIQKLKIQKEQFNIKLAETRAEHNKQIAASIAHELRTPLATVRLCVNNIKDYLSDLVLGYNAAKNAQLSVPKIDPVILNNIPASLNSIDLEADSAFVFIDMLLMNVNQQEFNRNLEPCFMSECIERTLARYPFKETERSNIKFIKINEDFVFLGNELLMTHVFFNLIKNALYYIAAKDGQNEIIISTIAGSPNRVCFKDTGTGISKDILPHIFERFFSRTRHGTGIGLAFCKMVIEAFGGKIHCQSVEGEYTEFIIELPRTDLLPIPRP